MNKLAAPALMIFGGLLLAFGNVEGCESLPLPIVQRDYPGAWVIVLEETQERTPAIAKLCSDAYWDTLEKRDLKFRFYDDDSSDADAYLKSAKSIPWLLVMSADGKVLASEKLPENVDALDSVVKRATGR